MEDAPQPANSPGRTLLDGAADLELLDQLLSADGWFEFPGGSNILQAGSPHSMSPFNSLSFSPLFEVGSSSSNPALPEGDDQDDTERSARLMTRPPWETQTESANGTQPLSSDIAGQVSCSVLSGELRRIYPGFEQGTNWWIQPLNSSYSIKEKFMRALSYIEQFQRDGDVLVQLWVPMKIEEQLLLSTYGQPFLLNPGCEKLVKYREISTGFQFSAEENSDKALGLPGRVFVGRSPEWTPDVRLFSSYEYPRVNHAQDFDVRGTIALPVFEPGNRTCVGVVELVMTTEKIKYTPELENICNALQAVDLRSSEVLSVPRVQVSSSYQAALSEIQAVLKAVCKTHNLPLAQTWIPCIQQGKQGCRPSDENYKYCISTVDTACYVNDPSMLGFREACSEHHLSRGEGVAGKALTTNQPCFSPDITASCKTEYPLSHYARKFNLRGAVAIRLRSIHTESADYVLEFFLPRDCRETHEQKLMLDSLSSTVRQVCQTLRVVTAKELEDEDMLQVNEVIPSNVCPDNSVSERVQGQTIDDNLSAGAFTVEVSRELSSWLASSVGDPLKEASSILEFRRHEIEGFGVPAHSDHPEVVLPAGNIFSEFKQHNQHSVKEIGGQKNSPSGDHSSSDSGKAAEKRRARTEKNVSLQVLRQYFSGSLKDAAKSIGVCPTTLKRICRKHGVTRWPSRKIKKVDHSLKKLQAVIDSVHGADKTLQISSLYKDLTKAAGSEKNITGSGTIATLNQRSLPDSTCQRQDARFGYHISSSSHSSSSRRQNTSSSLSGSSGSKQGAEVAGLVTKQEASLEKPGGALQRRNSLVDLHLSTQEAPIFLTRSRSHKSLAEHHSSGSPSPLHKKPSGLIRVKAMYGAEKVRLQLQRTWGFQELKQEISKRFNISNMSSVNLKYLDDDSEWVLLTCDADLQECIHVYRSSSAKTMKISVHTVVNPPTRSSFSPLGLS